MPSKNSQPSDSPQDQLVEGVDFYIENGLYVFTEIYLKKRGYCCKNKCRHCPYGEEVKRQRGKEVKI